MGIRNTTIQTPIILPFGQLKVFQRISSILFCIEISKQDTVELYNYIQDTHELCIYIQTAHTHGGKDSQPAVSSAESTKYLGSYTLPLLVFGSSHHITESSASFQIISEVFFISPVLCVKINSFFNYKVHRVTSIMKLMSFFSTTKFSTGCKNEYM